MNTIVVSGFKPTASARNVAAFGAGVLFAIGLVVSGMTQPAKVAGFLDFFGDWDPSLLGVMGAGVIVNFALHAWTQRARNRPLLDERFFLPTRRDIDKRLIFGAILFGVGWGLGGYCPGPGVVSAVTGSSEALVFLGFMILGVLVEKRVSR